MRVNIESRGHLLSTLAEAAELEHNLLCMYLYSVFSFKTSMVEGLNSRELDTVTSWRKTILEICFEEMTHLALVTNLTTAIGGGAHFFRTHFPVTPGHFPSDFVLELTPFGGETLQHFIFLERPEDEPIKDAEGFTPDTEYTRASPRGRLMTHVGDYSTVGQLYESIERGIVSLSAALGEESLFCGPASLQISSEDVHLKGLTCVKDKASALEALRLIVEQGEGARTEEGSHFEKFSRMADEYEALLRKNPSFEPARPAARNPLMRKPATSAGRVWITGTPAAHYLDLGNALYSLMLRFLVQVYSMENRNGAARKVLIDAALSLMPALTAIGGLATKLAASPDYPGINAGISFSLDRYFTPFEVTSEKLLLLERLEEISEEVGALACNHQYQTAKNDGGSEFSRALHSVGNTLAKVRNALTAVSLGAADSGGQSPS